MTAETAIDMRMMEMTKLERLQARRPHRMPGKDSPTLKTRVGVKSSYTFPKTSVPLVPPKPKEFFTAMSIFMSRAVLAQKSRSQTGS
jgi:hypothetical protein